MKYCSECAGPVTLKVPPMDTVARFVCDRCNRIFYQNPRTVVGTLPRWEDKVLLCRRSIEPRRGYWTLPSGFLENGETLEQGAVRETVEEAGADVSLIRLFAVFSLPHVSQIYMTFLADLENLEFKAGEESLEVKLVTRDEVPWNQIAFRAIEFFLERYFLCEAADQGIHEGSWVRDKDGPWIRGLGDRCPES